MASEQVDRVLKKLGFFYVHVEGNTALAGHVKEALFEVLILNSEGDVVGGPYADLVLKAIHALSLYDAEKEDAVFWPVAERARFLERISKESGLSIDEISLLTR